MEYIGDHAILITTLTLHPPMQSAAPLLRAYAHRDREYAAEKRWSILKVCVEPEEHSAGKLDLGNCYNIRFKLTEVNPMHHSEHESTCRTYLKALQTNVLTL